MVLQAQGWRGFDGILSSRAWGGGDNGAVGLGTTWVDAVAGSGMAPGAQHRGRREDNVVAGLRTVPAWSTVSPAQVREDGSA
jgi:hypothetical protein